MIDPDRYLIRTSEKSWGLFPFTEEICTLLDSTSVKERTAEDVLYEIQFIDVSVVVDPGPDWGVNWQHGRDVTEELLNKMGIRRSND
jgi:hypothetical protein